MNNFGGKEILTNNHNDIESLYFRHHHKLLSYFLKITNGNNALAEDLLQTLFLKLLLSQSKYKGKGSLSGWLFISARNVARDYYRRRIIIDWLEESSGFSEIDEADETDKDLLIDKVFDAITRLKPRDREIVYFAYHQGLSCRKIASILGISIGAAKTRLHRAVSRLKALL